jgi:membrane protease YdiL (CAAX protease family)
MSATMEINIVNETVSPAAPAEVATPARHAVPTARVFGRIALAAAVWLAVGTGGQLGLGYLVGALAPAWAASGWFHFLGTAVPLYGVALPLAALILRTVPDTLDRARLPRPSRPGGLLFAVLIAFAVGATYLLHNVTTLITAVLAELTGLTIRNVLAEGLSGGSLIGNAIILVVAAPLAEEFLFRGQMYRKLAGYGAKPYIFFSATAFGLMHVNVYQIGYAFVIGLILAGIVWQTGRNRLNVVAHALINATSVVGPLLLATAGYTATVVWGVALLAFGVAGLAAGTVMFVRRRRRLLQGFVPGLLPAPRVRAIAAAPGVLVFLGTVLTLLVGLQFLL